MEIAKGVHAIKCMFGGTRMVFVYLLVGEDASILIDTGCAHNPHQEILPYMAAIGLDPARLTYILITHSDMDHQGGNQLMKAAAPGALLMCHTLDRPWIESTEALIAGRYSQFEADHGIGYSAEAKDGMRAGTLSAPLDMTLSGGESFRLGPGWYVEAVHTPGHTWGHTAVFDPRSRTLIAGEASMWTHIPNDDWSSAMPPTYCYVDTYTATQDRLLSMGIDTLASAHWPVQRGSDVAAFIQESKNFCLHVEARLLALARSGAKFTLREAIDRVGRTLGSWPDATNQDFSYGMAGNLHCLTQRGLLRTGQNAQGHVTWSAI
jgi:glyoxylase-like metal-dependent hydrolase (beta-lactamase superfamily II)